jgi:hypothetical protein
MNVASQRPQSSKRNGKLDQVMDPETGPRERCKTLRPARSSLLRLSTLLIISCISAACFGDGPTAPSQGAVVTFHVVDETFRVHLLDERQINAAHQATNGGRARIPNGRIVAGTGVNVGWSWHLEDVEFAELTTEVCDGRPSDVEHEGVSFGAGRFCPWAAQVISIEED